MICNSNWRVMILSLVSSTISTVTPDTIRSLMSARVTCLLSVVSYSLRFAYFLISLLLCTLKPGSCSGQLPSITDVARSCNKNAILTCTKERCGTTELPQQPRHGTTGLSSYALKTCVCASALKLLVNSTYSLERCTIFSPKARPPSMQADMIS